MTGTRFAIAIVAVLLLFAGVGWSDAQQQDCPNGQCPLQQPQRRPIGGTLHQYPEAIVATEEGPPVEVRVVQSGAGEVVVSGPATVTYVQRGWYPGRGVARVGRGTVRVVARGACRLGRGTVRVATAPIRWACRRGRSR